MRRKFLLLLFVLITLFGCSETDQSTENKVAPESPVAENVTVMHDDKTDLISSSQQLKNGIYKIKYLNDTPPQLEKDDIIIGSEGKGYLRKVVSYTQADNILTIETTQATLDDVFNDAKIEFDRESLEPYRRKTDNRSLQVNYLRDGMSYDPNTPYTFDFSNTTIFEDENILLTIPEGSLTYNPGYTFEADYSFWKGLESLEYNTDDTNIQLDCNLNLKVFAEEAYEYKETLAQYSETFVINVGGIPLNITVSTALEAVFNASLSSEFEAYTDFTSVYDVDAMVSFKDGEWTNDYQVNEDHKLNSYDYSLLANGNQRFTIRSVSSIDFIGLVGPYANFEAYEEADVNVNLLNLDWDAEIFAGVNGAVGVDLTIFSYVYANYEWADGLRESIWNAPFAIENNGDGNVKVVDDYGNPLGGVPVKFKDGDGAYTMTDLDGLAPYGSASSAAIYKADGSLIDSVTLNGAN